LAFSTSDVFLFGEPAALEVLVALLDVEDLGLVAEAEPVPDVLFFLEDELVPELLALVVFFF
jgi:hypothetical protein